MWGSSIRVQREQKKNKVRMRKLRSKHQRTSDSITTSSTVAPDHSKASGRRSRFPQFFTNFNPMMIRSPAHVIDEPFFIAVESRLESSVFLSEGKESENYNAATSKRIKFGYKEKDEQEHTEICTKARYPCKCRDGTNVITPLSAFD